MLRLRLPEWRYWPAIPFVALIVLAIVGSSLAPLPPQQPQTNSSASEKTKSGSAVVATPKLADDRIADYTFWLMLSTAVLGGASIFQAYFIIRADKIAHIAAEAARDSARAAIGSERAWVLLFVDEQNFEEANLGRINAEDWESVPEAVEKPPKPRVKFHFENLGKTPAFVKEISHQLIQAKKLPLALDYRPNAPW